MTQTLRTTDPLLTLSSVHPLLVPSDFQEVAYTPELLLPLAVASSLVENAEYQRGCEGGFEVYFDQTLEDNGTEDRVYSWQEVKAEIIANLLPNKNEVLYYEYAYNRPYSLSYRAGFCAGWLSALALTENELAKQGMQILAYLVNIHHQQKTPPAVPSCGPRVVGGDGWPLDI